MRQRLVPICFLSTLLCLVSLNSSAQTLVKPPILADSWSQPYPGFKIVGNLYYVGTNDLACYLIATPEGHVLINTGLPGSASMIRASVEALGFRFQDIKLLLTTHAHYDHVGGTAEVMKLTGARMLINERDASVLEDGGNSDYAFGGKGSTFEAFSADALYRGGDTIRFGGMDIVSLPHPGHSKGANSFLISIADEQRSYKVLIANIPTVVAANLSSVPGYAGIVEDYEYTFEAMKKIEFDIFLASHAGQFGLHQKRKPADSYNPPAFVDRKGYDMIIDQMLKEYRRRLAAKN